MLYVFNRDNRLHIVWNASESTVRGTGKFSPDIARTVSFVRTGFAG